LNACHSICWLNIDEVLFPLLEMAESDRVRYNHLKLTARGVLRPTFVLYAASSDSPKVTTADEWSGDFWIEVQWNFALTVMLTSLVLAKKSRSDRAAKTITRE